MKKIAVLLTLTTFLSIQVFALPSGGGLITAPGTVTENSATLLWEKQSEKNNVVYEILLNGKVVGFTNKTNYTLTNLLPATTYTASVRAKQDPKPLLTLQFKTAAKGKIYNILDYGAKNDSTTNNTHAIQAAINACSEGGSVYVPKGTFVSGALFLKSNMTLYIEKGAVLKGSTAVEDYLPMILNRFEGWEMKTYASLLNAGTLNRDGSYNVKDLRITGGGIIKGGGKRLGDAMIKASGPRSRGRLICLMNARGDDG